MKKVLIAVVIAGLIALFFVKVQCDACAGKGRLSDVTIVKDNCSKCRGTGRTEWKLDKAGKGDLKGPKPQCLYCKGNGYVEREVPAGDCERCAGSGQIRIYQKLIK